MKTTESCGNTYRLLYHPNMSAHLLHLAQNYLAYPCWIHLHATSGYSEDYIGRHNISHHPRYKRTQPRLWAVQKGIVDCVSRRQLKEK